MLTGATGFIGYPLTLKLLEKGYDLVAAVRQRSGILPDNVIQEVVGGLSSSNNWSKALHNVSTVIHTAARVHVMNDAAIDPLLVYRRVNVEGTKNLAKQAAAAGVKRFIFLSSIKVNGEATKVGNPFTAEDTPTPIDPYGISKAESEQALLELSDLTGMEVVILRPVLVYGPGVKANFQSMMRWIYKGVPLPLGDIHNKRSFLALDTLIDLITTCIEHPAAANQIFLVSDGEDLSTSELLQRVGKALGSPARLFPVPGVLIDIAARLLGKRDFSQRLLGSLQVDISKTRDILSWKPSVSVDKELEKTAQAFLSKKRD